MGLFNSIGSRLGGILQKLEAPKTAVPPAGEPAARSGTSQNESAANKTAGRGDVGIPSPATNSVTEAPGAPVRPAGTVDRGGATFEASRRTIDALLKLNSQEAHDDPATALLNALAVVDSNDEFPARVVLACRPGDRALMVALAVDGLFSVGDNIALEAFNGLTAAAQAASKCTIVTVGPGATLPAWAVKHGYKAGFAAPLAVGSRTLGAVYMLRQTPGLPTPEMQERVQTVLNFAARLFTAPQASAPEPPATMPGGAARPVQKVPTGPAPTSRQAAPIRTQVPRPAVEVAASQRGPSVSETRPTVTPRAEPPAPTQPRSDLGRGGAAVLVAEPQAGPAVAAPVRNISGIAASPVSVAVAPAIQAAPVTHVVQAAPVMVARPDPSSTPVIQPAVEAVPVREQSPTVGRVELPGLTLDPTRDCAEVSGVSVSLSRIEFSLLQRIAAASGRAVPASTLLQECWEGEDVPGEGSLEVAVHRLRRKIARAPGGAGMIQTIRGEGYAIRTSGGLDSMDIVPGRFAAAAD